VSVNWAVAVAWRRRDGGVSMTFGIFLCLYLLFAVMCWCLDVHNIVAQEPVDIVGFPALLVIGIWGGMKTLGWL
jgi:hypothetical protein